MNADDQIKHGLMLGDAMRRILMPPKKIFTAVVTGTFKIEVNCDGTEDDAIDRALDNLDGNCVISTTVEDMVSENEF